MKQVRLMVAILVLVTGSAWAQKYWNFDVDGNNEGWFAGNDISSLSTSADSLNVVYGSSDPFIYSPDFSGSPIPGNTYQWIQVD